MSVRPGEVGGVPYEIWKMCERKARLTRKQCEVKIQQRRRKRKAPLYCYLCPACAHWHLTRRERRW